MPVSPASITIAVTTVTMRTSRQRGIRARATELTTILYVTQEGVYAIEVLFTCIREPKSGSTLNKRAYTGRGRGRKRMEEENTK
jgi:hypothetical protein